MSSTPLVTLWPQVKGKGLMHTYVWLGNDTETAPHLISEGRAPPGAIRGHGSSGGVASLEVPRRSRTTPRREMRAGVGGTLRVGSLAYRRPKRSITAPRNDHTPPIMQPSRRGGGGGGGGTGGTGGVDGGGAAPVPS
ncbi:hypothetical protein Vretifemale_5512 [Volvox reticuliferus]|uniref:Uncharacterized protein n=1 Tax=Volvox reticuliferus TaxID=1737510 RepID=A0A8J4CC56_9CHLO|nr:hypothetical protein Vretifemale_5512 [Volvox reticuliferus]